MTGPDTLGRTGLSRRTRFASSAYGIACGDPLRRPAASRTPEITPAGDSLLCDLGRWQLLRPSEDAAPRWCRVTLSSDFKESS